MAHLFPKTPPGTTNLFRVPTQNSFRVKFGDNNENHEVEDGGGIPNDLPRLEYPPDDEKFELLLSQSSKTYL